MGVIVTLRDDDNVSYFKEFTMELIRISEPDEVYISSGYFWKTDVYRVPFIHGFYFSFDKDHQGDSIVSCLRNKRVVLAGHMRSQNVNWDQMFRNTLENFRSYLGISNIDAYECIDRNFHSKQIFMRKTINNVMRTVVGIVGSSNCTRPAFGDINSYGNTNYGFNVEAGTYIFDTSFDDSIRNFTVRYQMQDENGYHIIQTQFQPGMNGGQTPMDLLDGMFNRFYRQLTNPNIFTQLP